MKHLLVLTLILTLVFPAYCYSTAMGVPNAPASTEDRGLAIIESLYKAVEEAQIHSGLLPTDLNNVPDTTTDQQHAASISSIFALSVLIIAYQMHQLIKTMIPEDPSLLDILEYLIVLIEYTYGTILLSIFCFFNPGMGSC